LKPPTNTPQALAQSAQQAQLLLRSPSTPGDGGEAARRVAAAIVQTSEVVQVCWLFADAADLALRPAPP
jgi:hypothetical protein